MLCVLGILFLFVRRMYICRQRKKRLESDNPYEVMAEAGIYMKALCDFDGKGFRETMPGEICQIFERTRFSNHFPGKAELSKVLGHLTIVSEEVWNNQKPGKKIRMVLIECLK